MSINRIKFTDTAGANEYILPINPESVDLLADDKYELLSTLDGAIVKSKAYFDDRVRFLRWPYYPYTNTTFLGMISVLKTYKNLDKKMDLQDIDTPFSYGSRFIRIIDVKNNVLQGGKLRVNMEVSYVYTQSY
jgi:hypothetical protein